MLVSAMICMAIFLMNSLSCRTQWIYDSSDVIYPSVYMSEQIRPNDRVKMVRGRVKESIRLSRRARGSRKPKVIAYFRYVFTDTKKYLNEVRTGFSKGIAIFFFWISCLLFIDKIKQIVIIYYCAQKDTYEAINTVKSVGGDGVVLWGSSYDLNTK